MKNSIWSQNTKLPEFKKLESNMSTDVLIIGGGLCGILCAHRLKEANINYILVEGNRIGSGITKDTTAKITFQHGLIYDKLIKNFGKEKALMYMKANQTALNMYKNICYDIDCDFEEKDAYTYSLDSYKKISNEINAVNSLGYPAEFSTDLELPFKTKGAIRFKNQAQINPLKFLKAISKDLNIYENTFVKGITSSTAIANNCKIKAKNIIITTHFPFLNNHGSYFLKLYQHRSYVSALKNAQTIKGMYIDEDLRGLSFRSYKDILLIGGGSHRTGKKGGCWKELEDFSEKYYPSATIKYQWSTQDCMTLDSVPYVGLYSKNTPNLYVATGFNKWGMTTTMIAAQILCDMVSGKKSEYADVFSPQRSILKPQLFINGFETATNFFTPTKKRCPHLGCALKWNKTERSWDCPCHGSRFNENGKIINNPATCDFDTSKNSSMF